MKHHAKHLLVMAAAVLLTACSDSNKAVTISINTSSSPSVSAGTVVVGGKEWMRCSLGQAWEGNTCVGEAKSYTFDAAKAAAQAMNDAGYAGKRDWRVPTVRELQSLRFCSTGFADRKVDIQDGGEKVRLSCNNEAAKPTIDIAAFPNTNSAFTGLRRRMWAIPTSLGASFSGMAASTTATATSAAAMFG